MTISYCDTVSWRGLGVVAEADALNETWYEYGEGGHYFL